MKLGDLDSDMKEHTGRLEGALPYTLVLFAMAAFGALIVWLIYAISTGYNLNDNESLIEKIIDLTGNTNLEDDEKDWLTSNFRQQAAFQGAVLGFLVIISYASVYAAMKIAHHKK